MNKRGVTLKHDLGELKAFTPYEVNDLVKYIETLLGHNEELESEIENLKEKIDETERDIEENFRPVPVAEQLDISDRDFI